MRADNKYLDNHHEQQALRNKRKLLGKLNLNSWAHCDWAFAVELIEFQLMNSVNNFFHPTFSQQNIESIIIPSQHAEIKWKKSFIIHCWLLYDVFPLESSVIGWFRFQSKQRYEILFNLLATNTGEKSASLRFIKLRMKNCPVLAFTKKKFNRWFDLLGTV